MCYRELTFRRGDIIYVRRQIDKNWYEGEHNAMIGLFPLNYVEVSKNENKSEAVKNSPILVDHFEVFVWLKNKSNSIVRPQNQAKRS